MSERWKEVDTMTSVVSVAEESAGQSFTPTACIVHVSESHASTLTRVLDCDELTVGRGGKCKLVIASSHVSRLHVRVSRSEAGWTVHDNKSVNGILINGVKRESAVLKFGDRVDLGRGEVLLFRPYDSGYQKALAAQRLESLGRLASGIAHDFNNILMAIVGATGCIRDEAGDKSNAAIQEALDDIVLATDSGAELARQLLVFSKKGDEFHEVVEVADLVNDVRRLAERTFEQRIAVHVDVQSDATVVADRGQLRQVLMNVCINARDAMPEGGDLKIEVYMASETNAGFPGESVCLRVEDTGVGMTDEVLNKVFEPFFSTKGEGGGTGLGMATSYGIIQNYGGNIRIGSKLGKGTWVSVFLPAQKLQRKKTTLAPQNAKTQSIQARGSGRTILLAEDQKLIRRHTSRVLRRLGFHVLEASDGVEAVEAVESAEGPISLALLDLQMPRRSGDEACRMILALDPKIPVVMVSGNIDDPRIEALVDSEGVDVLAKPFGSQDLARALDLAR